MTDRSILAFPAKNGTVWSNELLCLNLRIPKPKNTSGKLLVFAFILGGANVKRRNWTND